MYITLFFSSRDKECGTVSSAIMSAFRQFERKKTRESPKDYFIKNL